MKKLIEEFGDQLNIALKIASESKLNPATEPIHHVFVAGLGGSGIGGNLVSAIGSDSFTVPVFVSKTYTIPAFVGPNTLFLACSFSGNTEETISAIGQAIAQKAKIVCITSGGKLAQIAADNKLDIIFIPGHSNSPRASIGYGITQILHICNFYKLCPTAYTEQIGATVALLASKQADIQAEAKTLAQAMKDKFAVFYADARLDGVVVRTQQQIAENSKQLCHTNVFPEMNHNELVGWEFPEDLLAKTVVILLQTDYDHERVHIRMQVCTQIFEKKGAKVIVLKAHGSSFVEQSFYAIHLLDWVSFFLAELNQVDPFPVEVINYLKAELAKH